MEAAKYRMEDEYKDTGGCAGSSTLLAILAPVVAEATDIALDELRGLQGQLANNSAQSRGQHD